MTDVLAHEMVERLRQSLTKLLRWAECYQPRLLRERARYDAELDEAEDLLEATDAWMALNANPRLRIVPKKNAEGTND